MAGLCEYHLRDYDAALKSLLQTRKLGFQETDELAHAARLHLALVLIKLGNFETAIAKLLELTQRQEDAGYYRGHRHRRIARGLGPPRRCRKRSATKFSNWETQWPP